MPKKAGEWRTSLFEDQDASNQRTLEFVRSTEVYPLNCECFVYSLNCSGSSRIMAHHHCVFLLFSMAAFRVSFRKCLHIPEQTHKYMNCVSR